MTPSYVIYNPSNSIVFDSPHLDHLTHGILPPFKSYNDEKKISIKRYKIIDKDEVLDGHVEYQYENGNLVRCFIHETSELLQYNNFKYEITDGLVTCEKSFYNSELSRETYFEYNNMKQVVKRVTDGSYNRHYEIYNYLEDRLIDIESYVGKHSLDKNKWVSKHKINYRFGKMSSIEEIEEIDKWTKKEEIGNFKYKGIFLYDIYGNINKIHLYTQVQSRETGEHFPNWLQVEKSIFYDDKNRINNFNYTFNEPHPKWSGQEPKTKWKYLFSYD